ncbi:MAG: hypothetical protein ACRDFB_05385, partial [Rhabdochlamydiaceae bacterium]
MALSGERSINGTQKPTVYESQSIPEPIQPASKEVLSNAKVPGQSFARFLSDKAQEGFGKKESLKYRYIEMITAN